MTYYSDGYNDYDDYDNYDDYETGEYGDATKNWLTDKLVDYLIQKVNPVDYARIESEVDVEIEVLKNDILLLAAELDDIIKRAAEFQGDMDVWFVDFNKALKKSKKLDTVGITSQVAENIAIPKQVLAPNARLWQAQFDQLYSYMRNLFNSLEVSKNEVIAERARKKGRR